jgi:hypothetical protein
MKDIQKRFILFLLGCIGIRTLFVILAKNNPKYLPYMGYLAILPALGFTYIYLTNSRDTGAEVFGDRIWWNDLRPVHALLYASFAYSAINKYENSWMILLADVLIGLVGFLTHHYNSNSFSKLL